MRFFFDNNLPYRLARALDMLVGDDAHEVIALRDRFNPAAADEVWLRELKKDGDWIVLTGDLARRDKNREVWMASGLTTFFLAPAWLKGGHSMTDISSRLLKYWDDITEQAADNARGTCFTLSINGRIKRLPDHRGNPRKS